MQTIVSEQETLTENNQHYTMWEITDILKISESIKLLVKMKNVSYFTEKTIQTFWPTQYVFVWSNSVIETNCLTFNVLFLKAYFFNIIIP